MGLVHSHDFFVLSRVAEKKKGRWAVGCVLCVLCAVVCGWGRVRERRGRGRGAASTLPSPPVGVSEKGTRGFLAEYRPSTMSRAHGCCLSTAPQHVRAATSGPSDRQWWRNSHELTTLVWADCLPMIHARHPHVAAELLVQLDTPIHLAFRNQPPQRDHLLAS